MGGGTLTETGGGAAALVLGGERTANANVRAMVGQVGAISAGVDLEDSK